MCNLKTWHKWPHQRNRNRQGNRLEAAGRQQGRDRDFGLSRCTLLYIGWINNKVCLYGTGNCIRYPVINHSRKWSHSVVSDSLWPHGLYSPWNSPSQNTGVGSLSLLQGIFPTQGLNPGLPHCRQILYQLSHQGSPRILEWGVYPFSRGSSQPRNWTGVSCIAGWFFTNWATREAPFGWQGAQTSQS